jgi:protein-tyrosine phosphatase
MKRKKVLFVCLGNICRSPSAEAIMNHIIKKEGFEKLIEADSAGILAYHEGESSDSRMKVFAGRRGYELTGTARKFLPRIDFEGSDYIAAMDDENYNDLLLLDKNKKYRNKIVKMTQFCSEINAAEVPDPYYGGDKGFELVLDILEDAGRGLFKKIRNDIESGN